MGLLAQVVGVEIPFREINRAPIPSGGSLPNVAQRCCHGKFPCHDMLPSAWATFGDAVLRSQCLVIAVIGP